MCQQIVYEILFFKSSVSDYFDGVKISVFGWFNEVNVAMFQKFYKQIQPP